MITSVSSSEDYEKKIEELKSKSKSSTEEAGIQSPNNSKWGIVKRSLAESNTSLTSSSSSVAIASSASTPVSLSSSDSIQCKEMGKIKKIKKN